MSEYLRPEYLDFLSAVGRPGEGRTVVEIGCGDGAFLEAALRAMPGWTTAFGIDPDFDSVVKASERFESDMRVSFLQAAGDAVPLKASCADAVLISKALHHLRDPLAVLAEARRVLKPGGALVLNEQAEDGGADHSLWDAYHGLRGRIEIAKGAFMRPLYAMAEIDSIAASSGFAKARGAVIRGERLGGEESAAGMEAPLLGLLASLPPSPEREAIRAESERVFARMRGSVVRKPDQYLSEWKKGE